MFNSGSDLSLDAAMAKSAGGKTGKVGGMQFRPKSVTVDANRPFYFRNVCSTVCEVS